MDSQCRTQCHLGNKNDSVLRENNCRQYLTVLNNNYYNYYTEIILYMCVCVTTPSPTKST